MANGNRTAAMVEHYLRVKNVNQTAREFGVSRNTVTRALTIAGIDADAYRYRLPELSDDQWVFIRERLGSQSVASIARELKIGASELGDKLRKEGIYHRPRKVRPFAGMVSNLFSSGLNAKEIERVSGISYSRVMAVLSDQGVAARRPKYPINDRAFTLPLGEPDAYWLGFLFADGTCTGQSVTLRLSVKDQSSVEAFRDFVAPTAPVFVYQPKGPKSSGRMAGADIHCRSLCKRLLEFGMTPNKVHTLKMPSEDLVPPEMLRHLIRGYLDGDGWCTKFKDRRGNTCFQVGFCGNQPFLEAIASTIAVQLRISCPKISIDKRTHSTGHLRYTSPQTLVALRHWLYKDATIWLERKRALLFSPELVVVPPKYDISGMQELAKGLDPRGRCLSPEYLGAHGNLLWECGRGHQWMASPNNMRTKGRWCRPCHYIRQREKKAALVRTAFSETGEAD